MEKKYFKREGGGMCVIIAKQQNVNFYKLTVDRYGP